MTGFYLDHVLIAVHSLEQAAETFSHDLGFRLTPEGVHPGRGTHNRLIVFGGEYLELIAYRDRSEGVFRPTMTTFLERREGLYMFALGIDDIGLAVSELRSRGVAVDEPVDGSREGSEPSPGYTWKSAAVPTEATPGSETFIIQHDNTMDQRYGEPPGQSQHRNGVTGVHSLEVAVHDAASAASRWGELLDLQPAASTEELPDVDGVQARLRLRNCYLDFVSPTGPGSLAKFLEANGEAPYRLSLSVKYIKDSAAALRPRAVELRGPDAPQLSMAPEHARGVSLRFV